MAEFNFFLSMDDTDRVFAIKKMQGYNDMTGNEFAEKLLEGLLHRLFPAIPEFDENGELLNPEKYKGGSN